MSLSNAATISAAPAALQRLSSGEYSASSVFAAPIQALQRGLVRQTDGNYSIDKVATLSAFGTAAARTSPGLLDALSSLRLGG